MGEGRQRPEGLNGEVVYAVRDVRVGGGATVSVRVERIDRERETTTHERRTGLLDFAMMTERGATVEPLRRLRKYAPGFDRATVQRLADLWERWHLNGMRAGCAHQTPVLEADEYGRQRPSLDATPPCPETGYLYGRAWLTEPLPDGFLDELRGLFAGARAAEDEARAKAEEEGEPDPGSRFYDEGDER